MQHMCMLAPSKAIRFNELGMVMTLSFGEWLFWCWVCGVGNHLVHLSDAVVGADADNLLPWWVPMPIYYLYWGIVGDVGTEMTWRARQRLGYWPRFCRGF